MDMGAAGSALAAIGAVAGGAYAWWLRRTKDAAANRADVAESDAATTILDSQRTVYALLTERLTTLENDMRNVRIELATERQHSRRLELHIWRLEGLMRNAGIEPPQFSNADAVLVEGH